MVDHDVLADAFHSVKSLLLFLTDQVHLAKSAVPDDANQFKVVKCRLHESVASPQSSGVLHAVFLYQRVEVELGVEAEGVTTARGAQVVVEAARISLGCVPMLDRALQVLNKLFRVGQFLLLLRVGADFEVRGCRFIKLSVLLIDARENQRHAADASAHVLLTGAEVGELLGFGNTIDGQVLLHQ